MSQLTDLLTPQELSAYLEIPVATLYAWRCRGLGPASFRVGKHVRYRRSDVAAWVSHRLEVAVVPGRDTISAPPERRAGK